LKMHARVVCFGSRRGIQIRHGKTRERVAQSGEGGLYTKDGLFQSVPVCNWTVMLSGTLESI
jgi:hypothetical protein